MGGGGAAGAGWGAKTVDSLIKHTTTVCIVSSLGEHLLLSL